jgi:hypothetical protein
MARVKSQENLKAYRNQDQHLATQLTQNSRITLLTRLIQRIISRSLLISNNKYNFKGLQADILKLGRHQILVIPDPTKSTNTEMLVLDLSAPKILVIENRSLQHR